VGTLEVSSGGQLRSQAGQVGVDNAGQVIVGHAGAKWEVAGDLEVGVDDFAVLTVDDQADVQTMNAYVGRREGANATVYVLRNALCRVEKEMAIAEHGAAAMVLQSGGRVVLQGGRLDLASMPTGSARLSIELPGSILSASNSLADIGARGEAGVQVLGGGQFHTGPARLGVEANSLGHVFVAGAGSRWTVEGELRAGIGGEARLKVDDHGEVVVNGPLFLGPGAAIEGEGTISATEFIHGGTFSPGSSPGTLRLNGNLRLQPGSRTIIEIGGTEAGAGHDVVSLARGQVSLAGKLVVRFFHGFAPRQDQVFSFLSAADGIAGGFATVDIEGLAPGFRHELRPGRDGKTLALVALNDGVATSAVEWPRLSITRFGPQIVVECTSPIPGFILQGSTPGTPGGWSSLATNAHRLSFSPDSQSRLFRMVQP
jgi:T5SS/PEP-CTERM-associated repeat protein